MRKAPNLRAERFRYHDDPNSSSMAGQSDGVFNIPTPYGDRKLFVIACSVFGWDHIAVTGPRRCPTWEEMSFVKDIFFKDDEVVMQLHPAKADHINFAQHTLHLWRPQTSEEHEEDKAKYLFVRDSFTELQQHTMDRLHLAPCPAPIPLPPKELV